MSTQLIVSNETIQSVIKQYFAASRSDDKVEAMVACFADDCINHDPAEASAMIGHETLRQFFSSIATLFISVGLTEEFISINGNQAAVKWIGQGTGQNGQDITFEGIDLFEVNINGEIQSMRAYWNPAALMAQLQGEN